MPTSHHSPADRAGSVAPPERRPCMCAVSRPHNLHCPPQQVAADADNRPSHLREVTCRVHRCHRSHHPLRHRLEANTTRTNGGASAPGRDGEHRDDHTGAGGCRRWGNELLDPFLPQRGRAYQPGARLWGSCHAHFRSFTERLGPAPHPRRTNDCPRPKHNPRPDDAALIQSASTPHPCLGCIPTVHFPGFNGSRVHCTAPTVRSWRGESPGCRSEWPA